MLFIKTAFYNDPGYLYSLKKKYRLPFILLNFIVTEFSILLVTGEKDRMHIETIDSSTYMQF